MAVSGEGPFLFPSDRIPGGHQTTLKNRLAKNSSTSKDSLLSDL